MTKAVLVRVSDDMQAAIAERAADAERSVSFTVKKVLAAWLAEPTPSAQTPPAAPIPLLHADNDAERFLIIFTQAPADDGFDMTDSTGKHRAIAVDVLRQAFKATREGMAAKSVATAFDRGIKALEHSKIAIRKGGVVYRATP